MRIICMACNVAINFANNLLSWSASVPFLPSPFGTEFLAHAPVKLNAFWHTCAKTLTTWGQPPLILVCSHRTLMWELTCHLGISIGLWADSYDICNITHVGPYTGLTRHRLTYDIPGWHLIWEKHMWTIWNPHLGPILRPSCKRRGLPHQILFGRGCGLFFGSKPVITDELEVCLWCWSSAPWSPCYDMSFNAAVQYMTMINY